MPPQGERGAIEFSALEEGLGCSTSGFASSEQPTPESPLKYQGEEEQEQAEPIETEHKMHQLTLEFISPETEEQYMQDLWRRDSWQFALTNLMVNILTFFLVLVPHLFAQEQARLNFVVVPAVFTAVSVVVVVLLRASKTMPFAGVYFNRIKSLAQVLMMIGGMIMPLPTIFNAYIFPCYENEVSSKLLQCQQLMLSMVPMETVLYCLFTPLVLRYMNLRFRHSFLVCIIAFAQLIALGCYQGNSPAALEAINTPRPLAVLFVFPWLFMLLSVWNQELKDRKSYVLRKRIEHTHAQELLVTHLDTKASTEETLLSFLCHEIRNPYNGLLGYTELTHATTSSLLELANKDASSSGSNAGIESPQLLNGLRQIEGWCSSVLSSSQHMLDLLDNVLDLSKLENNKMALAQQPVNLYEICNEVNTLLQPTIKAGVRLVVEADPKQWMIGDQLRWRQLLVNLLSNAFKFTEEGLVHVRANVRLRQDGGHDPGASQEGELDVFISDTGSGVSEEQSRSLFKKFESNAFAHKGSGVGLALSQHITVLMGGGEIRVDSPYRLTQQDVEAGLHSCEARDGPSCSGTRLFFSVPFVACEPPSSFKARHGLAVQGNGVMSSYDLIGSIGEANGDQEESSSLIRMSFLLVEDDVMNQMIMKAKLQQLWDGGKAYVKGGGDVVHYVVECTAVSTAEEALRLNAAGDFNFDVILMDQHLENAGGVLTGTQATRQLRASGCTKPIIMCSGNCAEKEKREYFEAGASCVWPKPYPAVKAMEVALQDAVQDLPAGGAARSMPAQ
jgi:signal transduction histidine kinase/DNA-binding NarL/FixJ family response regulator